MKLKKHLDTKT